MIRWLVLLVSLLLVASCDAAILPSHLRNGQTADVSVADQVAVAGICHDEKSSDAKAPIADGLGRKAPRLPKHLLASREETEIPDKANTAKSRIVNLPKDLRPSKEKQNLQSTGRKLSDNPFWKAWKPHKFGQLTAKDCPAGDPLILTPYIRNGNISQAQNLARVRLPGSDLESYSGYLTVNQSDGSNTFFWFFPAEVAVPEDAPVLVWLQGGPGASSMFGIFDEHGPWTLTGDLSLKPRQYRWTLLANLIYIDNPVGTGFSFTKTDDGYARTEDQVGKNLYEALLQFYELFPQYQQGELYLSGESYAGKYVPALGYTIHKNNPQSDLKLPLRGVAIGNGFVDPENMLDFGDLLFNTGLADSNEADYLRQQTVLIQQAIQEGRYLDAFALEDKLMDGDVWKYPTYFYNITASRYYYNFLQSEEPKEFSYYYSYLNQCYVRQAIHVGNQIFDGGVKVEKYLLNDIFQTAKNYLVPLLENYRVLIYNGQLDLICALPMTENYLQKLQWKGADAYKNSVKYIWKVDDSDVEPAGYVRHAGDFYQIAVRKAGHMVPFDQPRYCFDMLYRFLYDQTFGN